jgi:hypothetical protein
VIKKTLAKYSNLRVILIGLGVIIGALIIGLVIRGINLFLITRVQEQIRLNTPPGGMMVMEYPWYFWTLAVARRLLYYLGLVLAGLVVVRKAKENKLLLAVALGILWAVFVHGFNFSYEIWGYYKFKTSYSAENHVPNAAIENPFKIILEWQAKEILFSFIRITGCTTLGAVLALGWENKRKLKAFVFKR